MWKTNYLLRTRMGLWNCRLNTPSDELPPQPRPPHHPLTMFCQWHHNVWAAYPLLPSSPSSQHRMPYLLDADNIPLRCSYFIIYILHSIYFVALSSSLYGALDFLGNQRCTRDIRVGSCGCVDLLMNTRLQLELPETMFMFSCMSFDS